MISEILILFFVLAPPQRLVKDEYGGESVQVEGNMGTGEGRSDYRSMSAPGKIKALFYFAYD